MVPENKLNEFVTRVRATSGSNVEAIILFGSAVSGEFHEGLSDLNLFCVLRDTSFAALQGLAPVVKWWNSQKQPPPLCMTHQELERSTDVFTIELIDMVQHHRVLYGDDVLKNLPISTRLHRVQVEYELREKLVLLRQHVLTAGDSDSRLWDVVLHSLPSFGTLFRHAFMVLGGSSRGRHEAVEELAKRLQFDASVMQQALQVREKKLNPKELNVKDVCARYLVVIERVASAVDAAPDSEIPGTK